MSANFGQISTTCGKAPTRRGPNSANSAPTSRPNSGHPRRRNHDNPEMVKEINAFTCRVSQLFQHVFVISEHVGCIVLPLLLFLCGGVYALAHSSPVVFIACLCQCLTWLFFLNWYALHLSLFMLLWFWMLVLFVSVLFAIRCGVGVALYVGARHGWGTARPRRAIRPRARVRENYHDSLMDLVIENDTCLAVV